MSAPQILEALTVTAELTGTLLSEHAKAAIVEVLLKHPLGAVMSALDRCRRDLSGRLTLAAILERLESADGRPGPDEAWATALEANDENETVVWSTEMRDAFSGSLQKTENKAR
ncbi:hypothetical protein ACUHMQ_12945 [Chitinimonas sp. PSY-7]|uniref:hypothetical protein n=1 Tax=Chitinimonas sp. PSY-7 TaxID=3459088 RepID=UPI0040402AE2